LSDERLKRQNAPRLNYWEIIADHLSKSRLELGVRLSRGFEGQTIFVADAHRGDGKRFVVRADEKLTTFVELKSAIRAVSP
jgi:hypothetical protein